jgi:hypothetical protein
MSLSFLQLGRNGIKDLIGSYVREHSSEIVICGIATAILMGVALLTTGDITQVLAGRRKH